MIYPDYARNLRVNLRNDQFIPGIGIRVLQKDKKMLPLILSNDKKSLH